MNCWGQGCVKNDNWVHEYFEVPKWENNVVVRFTFVNGGESLSGKNLFFTIRFESWIRVPNPLKSSHNIIFNV